MTTQRHSYHTPGVTDLAKLKSAAFERRANHNETTTVHYHPYSLPCHGQHHELYELNKTPETQTADAAH